MHFLYEESGDLKLATLMSAAGAAPADPMPIETMSGKRAKLKSKDVWLELPQVTQALPELLKGAQDEAQTLDLDFLWECAGEVEFHFLDLAKEYYGDAASDLQKMALAIGIQAAPIYFRRKGRGQFLRAPAEQLKAALLAVERKKQELLLQEQWIAQLKEGSCPEALKPQVKTLLFNPDKNSAAYKAVHAAAHGLAGGIPELFIRCRAIDSPLDFHQGRFYKEHFPKGIGFEHYALDCATLTQQAEQVLSDLPIAQVKAFSIDDASTTEIDDAFSVTLQADGNYQVGVHIAAPGLLIQPQDACDQIARQRLSTVYYPGGKITMLPQELVGIFSLDEGRGEALAPRPALSLYVTVDPRGQLLDRPSQTVLELVPIAHNLRLDDLEARVTQESLDASEDIPYRAELRLLWLSAQALHARRQDAREQNGLKREVLGVQDPKALLRDFSFKVEEGVVTIGARQRGSILDTIVAEWMIHTNSTWGAWLAQHDVPAIYRVQKGWGPQRTRMQTLPGPHEGLGINDYTWCTSPLRRYADLVNQWQLIAMVKNGVTAKLVAPFKPKDAQLMAIAADFDATYGAYNEYQARLEQYWCLQYAQQEGLPWKTVVRHLKDGRARVESIPLYLQIPELAAQARGARAEIEILAIDGLMLTASVRYLGLIEGEPEGEDAGIEDEVEVNLTVAIDQEEVGEVSPHTSQTTNS